MTRTLCSLLLIGALGWPAIAGADDPVERAAERAADAKKDNKPRDGRPQEASQANRPDAGDMADTKRVVEPKAEHGDKVIPARTGGVKAHKRHHRHIDSDKRIYDPTDAGRR